MSPPVLGKDGQALELCYMSLSIIRSFHSLRREKFVLLTCLPGLEAEAICRRFPCLAQCHPGDRQKQPCANVPYCSAYLTGCLQPRIVSSSMSRAQPCRLLCCCRHGYASASSSSSGQREVQNAHALPFALQHVRQNLSILGSA